MSVARTVVELDALSDAELPEALAHKNLEFYKALKDVPDPIAKRLHAHGIKPLWEQTEKRHKDLESRMAAMKLEDGSVAEDRFEILAELLDKVCQAFEIFDEHETRRIPFGHRLVLEQRLLFTLKEGFDMIEKALDKWDEFGEDRDAANIERQDLRLEIRLRDILFTEIHEQFLKSYLCMDW